MISLADVREHTLNSGAGDPVSDPNPKHLNPWLTECWNSNTERPNGTKAVGDLGPSNTLEVGIQCYLSHLTLMNWTEIQISSGASLNLFH